MTVDTRRSLRHALVVAATLLASQSFARAQSARPELDSLVGLYRAPDGMAAMIWRPVVGQVAFAFDSGKVRALAGANGQYHYGPSLGITEPSRGTVRSSSGGEILWKDGEAPEVRLARVPLRELDTTFSNGGVRLAGTVIFPPGSGPFGGVVMLQGSGRETRENSRVLAYFFASLGVASLIYDKRSAGASTGQSYDVPFTDLANDAIAGLHLLQGMQAIRRTGVGLFGPSQGSWIALAATTQTPDVAFLILQSGDALSPLDQVLHTTGVVAHARALAPKDSADMSAFRRLKYLYAIEGRPPAGWDHALADARRAPWFALTGDGIPKHDFWGPNGLFDPLPALRSYRGPVLAVFGARDVNKDVPRNAQMMRDAFARSGNTSASVLVFENANHGLFETTTGLPLERELPSLTRIVPGYLDALARFLRELSK